MAVVEAPAEKKGPSLIVQAAVLLALTVIAAGAGWLSGTHLNQGTAPAQADAATSPGAEAETPAAEILSEAASITTNLAAPADTWIRLELDLIYDQAADPAMTAAIHQDMLAFLRTVKLHQVEGASGFQHLRSDLEEIAALRSEGRVRSILIRTLLFE